MRINSHAKIFISSSKTMYINHWETKGIYTVIKNTLTAIVNEPHYKINNSYIEYEVYIFNTKHTINITRTNEIIYQILFGQSRKLLF